MNVYRTMLFGAVMAIVIALALQFRDCEDTLKAIKLGFVLTWLINIFPRKWND